MCPYFLSRGLGLVAILNLALLAYPLDSAAQDVTKVWHIGLIHIGAGHAPPSVPALRQKLKDLGYEDGKNLRFDFRNHKDEGTARIATSDFIREGVDLIVAIGTNALRAAVSARANTPILFLHITDPVGNGFVQSLSRPGGKITGFASPELIAKRLELFKAAHTNLQRVLSLVDPKDPGTGAQLAEARRAAQKLGLVLVERNVSTLADTKRVYDALGKHEVDGVLVVSSSLRGKFSSALIRMTNERRLPIIGHRRKWAESGALLSYGNDFASVGRAAATYVDKLLKGAEPANMPVDERSGILLILNLKTAKALSITFPQSILLRADEVIE